jgi:hypothetical protein
MLVHLSHDWESGSTLYNDKVWDLITSVSIWKGRCILVFQKVQVPLVERMQVKWIKMLHI